jgi:hypothetical protein
VHVKENVVVFVSLMLFVPGTRRVTFDHRLAAFMTSSCGRGEAIFVLSLDFM